MAIPKHITMGNFCTDTSGNVIGAAISGTTYGGMYSDGTVSRPKSIEQIMYEEKVKEQQIKAMQDTMTMNAQRYPEPWDIRAAGKIVAQGDNFPPFNRKKLVLLL